MLLGRIRADLSAPASGEVRRRVRDELAEGVRFVLARRIGEAFVTGEVPEEAVLATLREAA